jgi:hypothetical protein
MLSSKLSQQLKDTVTEADAFWEANQATVFLIPSCEREAIAVGNLLRTLRKQSARLEELTSRCAGFVKDVCLALLNRLP